LVRCSRCWGEAAAIGLRALGPEAFVGELHALLSDPAPAVRAVAALALAETGDRRAAPALRACVRARSPWIFEAIEALAALHDDEAKAILLPLAEGLFTPSVVRAAAGAALVALGEPKGIGALRRALRGFFHEGRSYAVERIGALRIAQLDGEIAALARRPRAIDPAVLAIALRSLAPSSESAQTALDGLLARSDDVGETARRAVSSLSS
jgi:hypothetical protein